MALRHRGWVVSPEIDEPELEIWSRLLQGSSTRDHLHPVVVDAFNGAITVEVKSAPQSDPLLDQLGVCVFDRVSHHPSHVVLFGVAATTTPPQHHQEQLHLSPATPATARSSGMRQ